MKIMWPLCALFLIGIVLFCERTGIKKEEGINENISEDYSVSVAGSNITSPVNQEIDTLVISWDENETATYYLGEVKQILNDMRASYDVLDINDYCEGTVYNYDKLILCISDLDLFGDNIREISSWVKNGGGLMNVSTYETSSNFQLLSGKMGIAEGGKEYTAVSGIRVDDNFMIGAKNREFLYDETYVANIEVFLNDQCKVYIESVDNGLPILWEKKYGDGKFVVMNQALVGKVCRGFIASAYSLLDDISIYPVINASTFYIDDFPAPVPSGNTDGIKKEFGTDINNFYSNIWWNDMLNWEEKYGIVHTGLIVEEYSDQVKAPFERNTITERYKFFGNMLLNRGGELGFHGYNHMPLCLDGFDYMGLYDSYKLWKSKEDIQAGLTELNEFSNDLFKETKFSVYVPPSNILSEEGREILLETLPNIKAIASLYIEGDCSYTQEFEVSEDGIVETPRIVSGAVFDEFSYFLAFSELNMHYVQSHFMHPDDVLDEDRGASLGWKKMRANFEEYLDFIYSSAPNIKDSTGSQMADSVKKFDALSVNRYETDEGMAFDIGGFEDVAYFMVRINEGELKNISGGTYENVTGNLFVIEATSNHVEIEINND